MCSNCMGGERDRMPKGEVAAAIDECGSSACPLWPFRYGRDPWRPEPSEEAKAAARERMQKLHAAVNSTSHEPKDEREADQAGETTGDAADAILEAELDALEAALRPPPAGNDPGPADCPCPICMG